MALSPQADLRASNSNIRACTSEGRFLRAYLAHPSACEQTLKKLRDDHAELIERIKKLGLVLETRANISGVGDLERLVHALSYSGNSNHVRN